MIDVLQNILFQNVNKLLKSQQQFAEFALYISMPKEVVIPYMKVTRITIKDKPFLADECSNIVFSVSAFHHNKNISRLANLMFFLEKFGSSFLNGVTHSSVVIRKSTFSNFFYSEILQFDCWQCTYDISLISEASPHKLSDEK